MITTFLFYLFNIIRFSILIYSVVAGLLLAFFLLIDLQKFSIGGSPISKAIGDYFLNFEPTYQMADRGLKLFVSLCIFQNFSTLIFPFFIFLSCFFAVTIDFFYNLGFIFTVIDSSLINKEMIDNIVLINEEVVDNENNNFSLYFYCLVFVIICCLRES